MLESLSIKNFRSCEDTTIRLGEPIVALVGKNGVGKTNVLHAIQLVADLCTGAPESIFSLNPRDNTQPTEFTLGFKLDGQNYTYQFCRSTPGAEIEIFEETLLRDNDPILRRVGESIELSPSGKLKNVRLGTRAASLSSLLQILPEDNPVAATLKPIAKYLQSIRYYPLLQGFQEHASDISSFIEAAKYQMLKADLVQGRRLQSVQLRLIHMFLTDPPSFEELKKLLGEDGLGLLADIQIEEVEVTRTRKTEEKVELVYTISFMPASGLAGFGRWFGFSGLSSGTWRILQLLTYVVFDKTSCMLIEQPEDCIHSGLLAKTIDILHAYAGRTQLICTTHSPRVINLVGAKGIRFVSAANGRTVVSELKHGEIEAATSYIQDEGTLSEYLETL